MKKLAASMFVLALISATAATAQVGAGIHVGGVGVGAHIGDGVGVGAHVGHVGVGVGAHAGRTCHGGWGWRNHERYCRRW
jgi:hypothetical protein